jgi:hypothetical protein
MSIRKLQKDILKFKRVILKIPIKHYYHQKYVNKVTQVFGSIFDKYTKDAESVPNPADKCPNKLEPHKAHTSKERKIKDSYN